MAEAETPITPRQRIGLWEEQAKVPGREGSLQTRKEPEQPRWQETHRMRLLVRPLGGSPTHLGTIFIHRVVSCKGDTDEREA